MSDDRSPWARPEPGHETAGHVTPGGSSAYSQNPQPARGTALDDRPAGYRAGTVTRLEQRPKQDVLEQGRELTEELARRNRLMLRWFGGGAAVVVIVGLVVLLAMVTGHAAAARPAVPAAERRPGAREGRAATAAARAAHGRPDRRDLLPGVRRAMGAMGPGVERRNAARGVPGRAAFHHRTRTVQARLPRVDPVRLGAGRRERRARPGPQMHRSPGGGRRARRVLLPADHDRDDARRADDARRPARLGDEVSPGLQAGRADGDRRAGRAGADRRGPAQRGDHLHLRAGDPPPVRLRG